MIKQLTKNTTHAEAFSWLMEYVNRYVDHVESPYMNLRVEYKSYGIQTAVAQFMLGLGSIYTLEERGSHNYRYALLTLKPQYKMPSRHITVHLPAGIGDIAWVMMKLQAALGPNGTCDLLISGEGPKRGKEFAEMYPCVKSVEYSDVGYQEIHEKSVCKERGNLEADFENGKEIYLSANSHMELGNRIEEYLPYYPVRYDLHNLEHKKYSGPVAPKHSFKIGIYPSSYKTNKEWNCGTPKKWVERIYQIYGHFDCTYPNREIFIYLIGATFDRRFASEIMRLLNKDKFKHVVNTVGLLHISDTIYMIKNLQMLVSFPSGIGIIGSMVDTPTVMMMPSHLKPMEYKWVDPKRIKDKSFIQLQLADIDKELLNTVCYGLNYNG